MKRTLIALVVIAAFSIGVLAGPASAAPSANACHGQFLKSFIQEFGSARAAADAIIGEFPQAVRLGQEAVRGQCAFLGNASDSSP